MDSEKLKKWSNMYKSEKLHLVFNANKIHEKLFNRDSMFKGFGRNEKILCEGKKYSIPMKKFSSNLFTFERVIFDYYFKILQMDICRTLLSLDEYSLSH